MGGGFLTRTCRNAIPSLRCEGQTTCKRRKSHDRLPSTRWSRPTASACTWPRRARARWSCSAMAFPSPGTRGATSCARWRRPASAPSRPTCAATARPTGPSRSTSTRSCIWSATWSACSTRSGERQAVIVGHDWGAPVAWHAALLRPDRFRGVVGLSVPFRPRSPVRPTTVDAADRRRDGSISSISRSRASPRPSSSAMCAGPSARILLRHLGRSRRTAERRASAWCRARAASSAAWPTRRPCRPGSARATSISTRASSRAPASAAASTGTATSTGAGSCWRRLRARR